MELVSRNNQRKALTIAFHGPNRNKRRFQCHHYQQRNAKMKNELLEQLENLKSKIETMEQT